MILERATLSIQVGREAEFETAFAAAKVIALESPGCRSIALARRIENPSKYLLLIEWDSVEAHTEVFRKSERFERFAASLRPHYREPPRGEHYEPVV